jgi:hypothetical protein
MTASPGHPAAGAEQCGGRLITTPQGVPGSELRVIPKLSVLAGHFVRPSRAVPARFDLRLGLLQAGCLQDADYA